MEESFDALVDANTLEEIVDRLIEDSYLPDHSIEKIVTDTSESPSSADRLVEYEFLRNGRSEVKTLDSTLRISNGAERGEHFYLRPDFETEYSNANESRDSPRELLQKYIVKEINSKLDPEKEEVIPQGELRTAHTTRPHAYAEGLTDNHPYNDEKLNL